MVNLISHHLNKTIMLVKISFRLKKIKIKYMILYQIKLPLILKVEIFYIDIKYGNFSKVSK